MVKEFPQPSDHRSPIVRISDPAGNWHELNLNDLRATCQRELGFRQRVYPKMVAGGKLTDKKAEAEIDGMRDVVDFLVHCIFKAVTRSKA